MRRWFLILITLAPLVALAPRVSAHFPATSGTISAELHMEPDDNAVVGKPETLYLILNDAANRFSLADCACQLSLSRGGQPILYTRLNLPPAGQSTVYSTAGVPFTFAAAGDYHVTVTGQPLNPGSFQPFTLNWNFQAAAPATGSDFSAKTFLKYFAAILGIFLLVAAAVFLLS